MCKKAHTDYIVDFLDTGDRKNIQIHIKQVSCDSSMQWGLALDDARPDMGTTRIYDHSGRIEQPYSIEEKTFDTLSPVTNPSKKGDMILFSGCTSHHQGTNILGTPRPVILGQIMVAWANPMEPINHKDVIKKVYPELQRRTDINKTDVDSVLRQFGDKWPFPLNLDKSQPKPGQLRPHSQNEIVGDAFKKNESIDVLMRLI